MSAHAAPGAGLGCGHRASPSGRRCCLQCHVTRKRGSSGRCLFCGDVGSLSREHVIPRWVGKRLGIRAVAQERSGTTRRLDALSVVLPQVCVRCNTGWMHDLEQRASPVLGPMLIGPASLLPITLDPSQQATLATWAIKTSLLLTYRMFKLQSGGWIPADNLKWLLSHARSDLPPPGARVWLGGIRPADAVTRRNLAASAQAGCLFNEAGRPVAHVGTFSLGHVLFQVFCCQMRDWLLTPQSDAWLAPTGRFRSSLLPIALSANDVKWPPDAVFATDAVQIVGERITKPPPGFSGGGN
jgi:hypothetical protein